VAEEAGPGGLPRVSVVVPVLDGLADLRRCVDALLGQDYPADRFEVVVADNGSAIPPGPQLPADPRLTVVREPVPGSYRARNAGLAVATGELVAFTDADCRPRPDWLRRAVAVLLAEPVADLVGGAVELVFEAGRPRSAAEWHEQLHGFPQQEYLARGFAVTANLVTRREVLDRVGPFDPTLASGGDAEWCRRVRDSGGVLRYAPAAVVRHPARATRAELLAKARRTTAGVATKALRRPGGRAAVARMMLGHLRDLAAVSLTVWRQPEPDTVAGRAGYLRLRWAYGATVLRTLAGLLLRGDRAG
jgi:GT2 family glycosyltransferase